MPIEDLYMCDMAKNRVECLNCTYSKPHTHPSMDTNVTMECDYFKFECNCNLIEEVNKKEV